jgi:DNA repair photolyase
MESYRNNDVNVCKECKAAGINCSDFKKCAAVRDLDKPRDYNGIRLTADGFDCALPVTIDSHSGCAYECLYCFSDNIIGHAAGSGGAKVKALGRTSLRKIESIFDGTDNQQAARIRKALRYDKRNANGYPCAVQLGGLCDPCDSIEQNSGWLLEFMKLAQRYDQPVRMSTKGAIFHIPEYMRQIVQKPHLFWCAFSIMSNDDDMITRVDRYTPNTTQRLATMRMLAKEGVSTSLRLRPIVPGITDRNRGHIDLIKRAADAGAKAISYEVLFYPMAIPKANRWKYKLLHNLAGIDLKKLYSSFGRRMTCMRPSYAYTEHIMHEIKETATANGLTVGVSDPVWKQLSDVGCCCGIRPDDPVFGNWEPENMTNAIVKARLANTPEGKLIHLADIVPPWAYDTPKQALCAGGVGPLVVWENHHKMWSDQLRELWNNPSMQRSPMNYLQGAVQIAGEDTDGNYIYRYVGLTRTNKISFNQKVPTTENETNANNDTTPTTKAGNSFKARRKPVQKSRMP